MTTHTLEPVQWRRNHKHNGSILRQNPVGRSAQRAGLNFVLWGLLGELWRIGRRSVFRLSSCHASIKQESGSLIIHIVGSGGSGLYRAIFALTFWSNFHNSICRRFACWGLSTSVKLFAPFSWHWQSLDNIVLTLHLYLIAQRHISSLHFEMHKHCNELL